MDVRKSIDESVIELKNDLVEGQLFILPTEKQIEKAIAFEKLLNSRYTLEVHACYTGLIIFDLSVNSDEQLAITIYDEDKMGYAYLIKDERGYDCLDIDHTESIPNIIETLIEKLYNIKEE